MYSNYGKSREVGKLDRFGRCLSLLEDDIIAQWRGRRGSRILHAVEWFNVFIKIA